MDEHNPNELTNYIAEEYLSPSQIEICKEKVNAAATVADNMACLTLIDSFVRANGKANTEYETLFAIVQNAITANSESMVYPEQIKVTIPMLFMLAFFDYLVLTGVMSGEDLERMSADAMRYGMNGGPAKA